MKHAYLIMAHNDFELLKTLILMLDDARNDIYLHVDRKAKSFNPSEYHTSHAQLIILDHRMDVRWGHVSQINLELLLFDSAFQNGSYAYYHLLSGVDLPIKSQDYIHEFFAQNQGKEFVGFWHDLDWQALMRVSYYYFFMRYERIDNKLLSILASKLRRFFWKILPKRKAECEYKKGPNWVSITNDFCEYLLSHKEWIRRRFRFTRSGDEIFLQTILWNSPFKDKLYSVEPGDYGAMREVDWSRGSSSSPYVWRTQDSDVLRYSSNLFARKFSSDIDMHIIETISKLFP